MAGILDFLQDYESQALEDEDVSELDQQFLNLEPRHPARRASAIFLFSGGNSYFA